MRFHVAFIGYEGRRFPGAANEPTFGQLGAFLAGVGQCAAPVL
jgi:hypothetical protein